MKVFITACIFAIVIAVAGGVVLNSMQKPVDEVYKTESVRLGT